MSVGPLLFTVEGREEPDAGSRCRLRHRLEVEAEALGKGLFGCLLLEHLPPVSPATAAHIRQRGGVAGEGDLLGRGLLERVDVAGAVPGPLPAPLVADRQPVGDHPLELHRLVEPEVEEWVEDLPLDGGLVGFDLPPVGDPVATHRGVVALRGVHARHHVGHVEGGADLRKDPPLKLRERARGMLGLHLDRLPAVEVS